LSRRCRPVGATRLAGGVPDVTPLVEMWARGSRFRRLVEPPVRAVKAGRSPPGGEALRARSCGGHHRFGRAPGPFLHATLSFGFGFVALASVSAEGGWPRRTSGAGHSSVTLGDMMRYGRSRLGSSTSSARPKGSHAENELAAGCAGVAHPASARQRISPSRRP
jgi:hypothetical protein